MKCQILFSRKNKKNIISLPSAKNAQRVVKVKQPDTYITPREMKSFANGEHPDQLIHTHNDSDGHYTKLQLGHFFSNYFSFKTYVVHGYSLEASQ